jgi:hypothetical protein
MKWTEESNKWAHLALGSVTLEATFWQETRFRRTQQGFEAKHWRQPFQSTVQLCDPRLVTRRFEAARLFWEHFHPHADIVALLRGKLEQEPMELQRAADWCVSHGLRAPVDARWINWEPDYEEAYYRELAQRAKTVYLFRNEYLFVFEQTVISEIPQSGNATYIFHPSTALTTFLYGYAKTNRHAIRTDARTAKAALGYAGRIPHLKDISGWIAKVEQTFVSPITGCMSKGVGPQVEEDETSGVPFNSPSMAAANGK